MEVLAKVQVAVRRAIASAAPGDCEAIVDAQVDLVLPMLWPELSLAFLITWAAKQLPGAHDSLFYVSLPWRALNVAWTRLETDKDADGQKALLPQLKTFLDSIVVPCLQHANQSPRSAERAALYLAVISADWPAARVIADSLTSACEAELASHVGTLVRELDDAPSGNAITLVGAVTALRALLVRHGSSGALGDRVFAMVCASLVNTDRHVRTVILRQLLPLFLAVGHPDLPRRRRALWQACVSAPASELVDVLGVLVMVRACWLEVITGKPGDLDHQRIATGELPGRDVRRSERKLGKEDREDRRAAREAARRKKQHAHNDAVRVLRVNLHDDWRCDPGFWTLIEAGLLSHDELADKRATLLLKHTLTASAWLGDFAAPSQAVPFRWAAADTAALERAWATLILALEATREHSAHLVEPLWNDASALLMPRDGDGPLHTRWVGVMILRLSRHNTITVRMTILKHLLSLPWSPPMVQRYGLAFFRDMLLPMLDSQAGMHRNDMPRLLARFWRRVTRGFALCDQRQAMLTALLASAAGALDGGNANVWQRIACLVDINTSDAPDQGDADLPVHRFVNADTIAVVARMARTRSWSLDRTQHHRIMMAVVNLLAHAGEPTLPSTHADAVAAVLQHLPPLFLVPGSPPHRLLAPWMASLSLPALHDSMHALVASASVAPVEPASLALRARGIAALLAFLPPSARQDSAWLQSMFQPLFKALADVHTAVYAVPGSSDALIAMLRTLLREHVSADVSGAALHHVLHDGTARVADAVAGHIRTRVCAALAGGTDTACAPALDLIAVVRAVLPQVTALADLDRVLLDDCTAALASSLPGDASAASASRRGQAMMIAAVADAASAQRRIAAAEGDCGAAQVAQLLEALVSLEYPASDARSNNWVSRALRDDHASFSRHRFRAVVALLRTHSLLPRGLLLRLADDLTAATDHAALPDLVHVLHALRLVLQRLILAGDPADVEMYDQACATAWRAINDHKPGPSRVDVTIEYWRLLFAEQPDAPHHHVVAASAPDVLRHHVRSGLDRVPSMYQAAPTLARLMMRVLRHTPALTLHFLDEVCDFAMLGAHHTSIPQDHSMLQWTLDVLPPGDEVDAGIVSCALGHSRFEAQARVHAFVFLDQLQHAEALLALADAMIQRLMQPPLSLRCVPHGEAHRRKSRLLQALTLVLRNCVRHCPSLDSATAHTWLERLHRLAELASHANVRFHLELCMLHLTLIDPVALLPGALTRLNDPDVRPGICVGLIILACNTVLLAPEPLRLHLLPPVLRALHPHTSSHNAGARHNASAALFKLLAPWAVTPDLKLVPESEMQTDVPAEVRAFLPLVRFIMLNRENSRHLAKHVGYLSLLDSFSAASSLQGVLMDAMPVGMFPPAERVPMSAVLDALDNHPLPPRPPPDLPTYWVRPMLQAAKLSVDWLDRLEAETERQGRQRAAQMAEQLSEHVDYQRKIAPWSERSTDLSSSPADARAEIVQRAAHGSGRSLIVCASFIDRVPNLAGLTRTCEIFRATELVVDNLGILSDPMYSTISVTAEKWVRMRQVKQDNVLSWLGECKRDGYTIVAVEQTANSTSLDAFSFPDKVVLVLGREREGCPVDVLQAVDHAVEIPQLGVVRSLNVHVSASIMIWEYTKQKLDCMAAADDDARVADVLLQSHRA